MIIDNTSSYKRMVLNCVDGDKDNKDYRYPIRSGYQLRAQSDIATFSRRNLNPRVRYQGSLGSCVGMSGVSVLEDSNKNKGVELSPFFLYKNAQFYDEWAGEDYSGTSISGACKSLRKDGCCQEAMCPYPMKEEVEVPKKAYSDAYQFRIKSYFKIDPNDTLKIKEALQHKSLWTSLMLKSGFYDVNRKGVVPSENYLIGADMGGHAVCLVGWKYINNKLFWEFKNSWGTSWGDHGYFFMEDSIFRATILGGIYFVEDREDEGEELLIIHTEQKKWYNKILVKITEILSNLYDKFKRKI